MILKTCRLCLEKGNSYIPLLSESNAYALKLQQCIPEINHFLIKNPVICQVCAGALDQCYEFRNRCLYSEEQLTQESKRQHQLDLAKTQSVIYTNTKSKGPGISTSYINNGEINIKLELDYDCDDNESIQENLIYAVKSTKSNHKKNQKRNIKCSECDRFFKHPGNMTVHIRAKHRNLNENKSTSNYMCNICMKLFNDIHHLKVHKETHFICNICNYLFNTKEDLEGHINNHKTDNNINKKQEHSLTKPSTTSVGNINKNGLRSAMTSDSELLILKIQDVLKCKICTKEFDSKKGLVAHEKYHNHKLRFRNWLNPKAEVKVLTSKMKSKHVSKTRKKFQAKTKMLDQKKMHTFTVTPHSCEICNDNFENLLFLNNHKFAVHVIDAQYQCKLCFKGFQIKQRFDTHMAVHSDEKPFKCKTCNKGFKLKGALKVHTVTHMSERPFHCTICKKGFTTKGNLAMHSRIHSGEKPFQCPICQKCFSIKKNMLVHIDNIHKTKSTFNQSELHKGLQFKV